MKDKQLVAQFILESSNPYVQEGLEGWIDKVLSVWFMGSKENQQAAYQTWIEDKKTRTQAALDALEANKIAAADKLNADLIKLSAEDN